MKKLISTLTVLLFINISFAQNEKGKAPQEKEEVESIFQTTESLICNPAFVEGKEWAKFRKTMLSQKALKLDEIAFIKMFNKESEKLPFTHYELRYPEWAFSKEEKEVKKPATFEVTKLSDQTMMLTIRKFSAEVELMQQMISQLKTIEYDNLIIDLRSNTGGTMDAAIPLVQYLSNKVLHGGYFLSRDWFLKYGGYPTDEQLSLLTPLTDPTYEGFTKKMKEDMGMSLIVPPNGQPVFEGNVFVLTSDITASACEPLVFGLKNQKMATIVGEKTYGGMLSAYLIPVANKYSLYMPLSDYVTVTNERLDKIGVEPHHKVKPEKALTYVQEKLIK